MTCPNCARMAAELAELRGAIGLAWKQESEAALYRAFKITPMNAALVLHLCAAAGRPVLSKSLEGNLNASGGKNRLKVHIWQIRQTFGSDFIETVAGYGYRMSAAGRERVLAAINPVEIAA